MIDTIDFLYSDFFGYFLIAFPILIYLIFALFAGIDGIVNFFRGTNRRFR